MQKTAPRITASPEIMLGQPVVQGTRITVALLLRKLAEGASPADLQAMYPRLATADIEAAIAFAENR